MNTIRQIKKSRFVGFTVLVASLAMIATLFAAAANPGWVNAGQWAWRIISGAGTMITYGQLLNEINKQPDNTEARLHARPELYDNPIKNASWADGPLRTHETGFRSVFANMGNYAYEFHTIWFIEWDEDQEQYTVDQFDRGFDYSAPKWVSKRQWDMLYASSNSAQKPLIPFLHDHEWTRTGFWLHHGRSYDVRYPPVTVFSDVYNPALFQFTLDGELKKTAKNRNLTYNARIHCELQRLTWVEDRGWGDWVGDDWVTNDPNESKYNLTFPGYEDATKSGINICPQNYKISGVSVRGGMDIWWNRNVNHVNAVVETQALDSQGDPTGPVTRHEAMPQKNIEWVIDYSRLPN